MSHKRLVSKEKPNSQISTLLPPILWREAARILAWSKGTRENYVKKDPARVSWSLMADNREHYRVPPEKQRRDRRRSLLVVSHGQQQQRLFTGRLRSMSEGRNSRQLDHPGALQVLIRSGGRCVLCRRSLISGITSWVLPLHSFSLPPSLSLSLSICLLVAQRQAL